MRAAGGRGAAAARWPSSGAFPYHPHVTVAHHLSEARLEQAFVELERYDAAFDVREMWMYLHEAETGWTPNRAFPLGG